VNRQRVFALLSLAAAGYALFRATQRVEMAADEVEHGGSKRDVVIAVILAVAAMVLALQKAKAAATAASQAFEPTT
jgi:hypothetical protein